MRRATSRSRHTGMPCTARCSISRKTLRLAVFSGVGGAADGSVLPGNRPTRRVSRGPVGRDCRETSDSPCLPVSAGRDCRETFRLAVKPARGLRLPGNLPTRCQTCPRDRGVRREPSDSPCFPGSVRRDCRETFRLAVFPGVGASRLPGNLPTRRASRGWQARPGPRRGGDRNSAGTGGAPHTGLPSCSPGWDRTDGDGGSRRHMKAGLT